MHDSDQTGLCESRPGLRNHSKRFHCFTPIPGVESAKCHILEHQGKNAVMKPEGEEVLCQEQETPPPQKPRREWKCLLCSKKNPEETKVCQVCGRQRGHNPKEYERRLQEIRSWNDEEKEEGSIADYCGLFVGLIILALILAVLTWAYYQDKEEHMRSMNDEEL
eukprot:s151_g38.t2